MTIPDLMSEIKYYITKPAADGAVLWSSCGIDWPLSVEPVLSEKDAAAPALADFDSPFEVAS